MRPLMPGNAGEIIGAIAPRNLGEVSLPIPGLRLGKKIQADPKCFACYFSGGTAQGSQFAGNLVKAKHHLLLCSPFFLLTELSPFAGKNKSFGAFQEVFVVGYQEGYTRHTQDQEWAVITQDHSAFP